MREMDGLLKQWRQAIDDRDQASSDLRDQLLAVQLAIGAVEEPYNDRIATLETEIKAAALALGKTYKLPDIAAVNYRKGAVRVTYNWRAVDSVTSVLRDILPETAASLAAARSETQGAPSVSIKAL